MYWKEGQRIIPAACLFCRLCVSEREKLYHSKSMLMLYTLCIRKREIVSNLQYIYVLDFVYQKKEIGMFLINCLCTGKTETASYLHYVYVLCFVHQKAVKCIMPTVCLCSRFCVLNGGQLHHSYSMFMF